MFLCVNLNETINDKKKFTMYETHKRNFFLPWKIKKRKMKIRFLSVNYLNGFLCKFKDEFNKKIMSYFKNVFESIALNFSMSL